MRFPYPNPETLDTLMAATVRAANKADYFMPYPALFAELGARLTEYAKSLETGVQLDKHGVTIKEGDLLKESAYFHGIRGSGANFPFDAEEYVGRNPNFRFFTYLRGMKLDIARFENMGWPVSRYEIEIVTPEQAESLKAAAKYDEYYSHYRLPTT